MLEPTARFKDSINGGDVVIELNPGQTLRHHLQAQQSRGNDFMGFTPRPPDVF